MPQPMGPTVPRWQLGSELHHLREAAGKTLQDVAEVLGCSDSKIRKIEGGDVSVVRLELAAMLDMYGVRNDQDREQFFAMAKLGKVRGWWVAYGQIPSVYAAYIGLETAATSLRNWEPAVVPGLCQTADYAMAINDATAQSTPQTRASHDAVERGVKLRLARQERLTNDNPLQFWSIIDEAALRREVGSPATMRAQLDHLLQLGELPNVTLQVLPFTHGAHPGVVGSLAILEFPEGVHSPVAYTEGMGGAGFMENADDLQRCNVTYQHLTAAALSVRESTKMIAAIAHGL